MGGESSEEKGGYMPWWAIDKAAWRERFSVFYRLASITEDRTKPLPRWTDEDVEEFIRSDSVHGPRLKLVRQGAQVAAGGAVVGGLTSAGVAMRYSKNSFGAFLAFVGGAAVSWAVAEEGANLALGLYKFDCLESNLKFLDWWQAKSEA